MSVYEVRKWADETLESICKDCEDTCCDVTKHLIVLAQFNPEEEEKEVHFFMKRGMMIYHSDELNHYTVTDWINHRNNDTKIYNIDGEEIMMPSLIQVPMRKITDNRENVVHKYVLYSDRYCPFYNKEKGCVVHDDPQRPRVSREYPVGVKQIDNHIEIIFSDGCKAINKPEIIEDFKKRFPEPGYLLIPGTEEQ